MEMSTSALLTLGFTVILEWKILSCISSEVGGDRESAGDEQRIKGNGRKWKKQMEKKILQLFCPAIKSNLSKVTLS